MNRILAPFAMALTLSILALSAAIGNAAPACGRMVAVDSDKKPAASGDAIRVATRWLEALRKHDVDALTKAARYPFTLRDTKKEGHCDRSRTAPDPDSTPATIDCLIKDDLLAEDLKGNPPLSIESVSDKQLPRWAKAWRKDVASGMQPIAISFYNDGDAWEFLLLVADGGVKAVWKTCTLANN